ncbi:MAG: hypothetical protein L0154_23990 [Chloroflexi bacterium]|nr:hypothetical protein [Chloroflexota bacterium]
MSELEYINPDFSTNRRPRWLAVVVMVICAGIIAFTGNRFHDALVERQPQSAPKVCDITNQTNMPVPVYMFPYAEDHIIDTIHPGETRVVISASRLFYQVETADGEKGLVRKEAVQLNGLCRSKR